MKIEINHDQLVDTIVERVIQEIKPLLNSHYHAKNDELLDVQGLAEYLKVKPSWVYEKVHSRQIPFRKACKFPRFPKKHIDLWLLNPYHPDLSIYNLNSD